MRKRCHNAHEGLLILGRGSPASRTCLCLFCLGDSWRRGWDSNPRTGCPVNGFRDRPIQPLWHLSGLLHVGGEGGIRTHGRVSPTHAFQACSLSHSDTSPRPEKEHAAPPCRGAASTASYAICPRPRLRSAKKPESSAPHSSASTPAVTSSRWFNRGSWVRFPRVPQ